MTSPSWFGRAISCALALASALAAQFPAASLRVERELFLRPGESHVLAWSHDGRWVASGGECGEVLVVDAATGAVRHELEASDHWLGALRFSPDDTQLAVMGRELSIWDLTTGGEIGRRAAVPFALDWSRDGALLAIAGSDTSVDLLDARDLTLVRQLELPKQGRVGAIAFSPAGDRVAIGTGGACRVFAVSDGRELERHEQLALTDILAWLDDQRLLRLNRSGFLYGRRAEPDRFRGSAWGMAADPSGGLCAIWNGKQVQGFARDAAEPFFVEGGGPVAIERGGKHWVRAMDGRLEFFAGAEAQRHVALPHRARPWSAAFTAGGRYVALGDRNGVLGVWRLRDGTKVFLPAKVVGTPLRYDDGPELVLWQRHRDTQWVCRESLSWWSLDALAAGESGLVREAGFELFRMGGYAFTSDCRFVAGAMTVLDLIDPEHGSWEAAGSLEQSALSPDGAFVASTWGDSSLGVAGGFCELRVFGRDGLERGPRRLGERGYDCTWSPDGTRIAWTTRSGLRLVDPKTLDDDSVIPGNWWQACWVDAQHVLLVGQTHELTLLRVADGAVLTRLEGAGGNVLCVDTRGEHAIVAQRDRALLVRVDTGAR